MSVQTLLGCLLVVSLLPSGCKRLSTQARLSDSLGGNAACYPKLHDLVKRPWKHHGDNISVTGFFDEQTIKDASYLWQISGDSNKSLDELEALVAVAGESFVRRRSTRIKRWILVAAEKKLIIRDQRLNRTFVIPDLIVNKMWVSRDSESVAMQTSQNREEFVTLKLEKLATVSYVNDPLSIQQHFDKVMQQRTQEIKNSSSFLEYGFAYQLPEMTQIFRNREYSGNPSAKIIAEMFHVRWFNDPRGEGFKDFPWPAANLEGYFVMVSPKGATTAEGEKPFYGPGSYNSESTLKHVTAFGINADRGLVGSRHWFTAQRRCSTGHDNRSVCEHHIYSHRESNDPSKHEQRVYSYQENAASRAFAIRSLAVGPRSNGRQLLALGTGVSPVASDIGSHIKLLEWNYRTGQTRVLRTLSLDKNINQMRFAADDLLDPDPFYLGRLYVESVDEQQRLFHETIDLDAFLRPIMVGQHQKHPSPPNDWRFSGARESLSVWRDQSPDYMQGIWNQLTSPLNQQVSGLAFDGSADCETLISGGTDGELRLWNLKTLGNTRTQYNLVNDSIKNTSIISIERNTSSRKLTVSFADGRVAVWNLDQLTAPPKIVVNTEGQNLVVSGVSSDADQLITVQMNNPPHFYDTQGQLSGSSIDDVSQTRLLNHNSNPASITALAPLPSSSMVKHLHLFANNFGTIMSSNIRQTSGGEVHQIQYDSEGPGYVTTKLITNRDGTWVIAAGSPSPGASPGTLRRLQLPSKFASPIGRFDHCPNKTALPVSTSRFVPYEGHTGTVMDVVQVGEQGGERMISVGLDGRLIVWSMLDPCTIPGAGRQADPKIITSFETASPLTSVAVTKNGDFAAAGTVDGRVLLFWLDDNLYLP